MRRHSIKTLAIPLLSLSLALLPLGCGSTGPAGPAGPAAPPVVPPVSPTAIDASTTPDSILATLDIVSTITGVTIASPPVVSFTFKTAGGAPIIGLVPFWEDNNRFIRFTLTKLVAGQKGDPDSWVAYVRDATSGEPDYDSGASLVDNGDGSYLFTFSTDVTNVSGVTYEPTLTHRVAGQIGQFSTVALEEQNLWLDFVPNGSSVTHTRNLAVMTSCNECHDNLAFHGRRFEVQYCVQCHNPDLAQGEGNFSFMIHRIHNAGKFKILDGGVSYEEVTYPQEVMNCRKCHNADDAATPQADNWRNLPNMAACGGCHDVFTPNTTQLHTGGQQTDNARCSVCHSAAEIMNYHTTPNSTENNPELLAGQRKITYEMVGAAVDGTSNAVTVRFKILSNGTPVDLTNLPADFRNGSGVVFRYPGLLLAWAQAQGSIAAPADYNNLGRAAGQPLSLSLDDFAPIQSTDPIGTLAFDVGDGILTATITNTGDQFPVGATMRAVALQGYLQQDLNMDGNSDVALHAPSVVAAVAGDAVRREVIDTTKCAQCHEFFEGHGGNRVFSAGSANVCVFCHVPNLTSSSRQIDLGHIEDSQNLKDMIHGIHASAFRDRDFEHWRNRSGGTYYNWSEVTFPRGASTGNCMLCHKDGTYELPLPANLLPTTVRTTGVADGQDADVPAVNAARASVPNATDWVNTPMGSSCFYCHTSRSAWAHMVTSGAQLSMPAVGSATYINRQNTATNAESCVVCHGPGKVADIKAVHNR